MSQREFILQQALALPPEDRAYVATVLEDSLEEGRSSETFLIELRRRSAAYRAGETLSRLADEMLADLRRRQDGEKSQENVSEKSVPGTFVCLTRSSLTCAGIQLIQWLICFVSTVKTADAARAIAP